MMNDVSNWLFAIPFLFAAPVGFLVGHLIWKRHIKERGGHD